MPRQLRIIVCVLGAGLSGIGAPSAFAADDVVFHHENVLGTSLELQVRADSAEAARWAEDRVLREIDRLSAIFSGYDTASEFSRWQSSSRRPIEVSAELFEVLRECDRWGAKSGGAFDPRVEALSQLWSRCAAKGRTPTTAELAEATALMARPAWRLDPNSRTVERLSLCPLSLNAIAKGYIVERACAVALAPSRGVRGLLLNVGGDLRVCGEVPRTIGIASPTADSESSEPLAHIEVRNQAVATSGRSQRGFKINSRWYSHVIDPRSWLPTEAVASATVIAERSADADALATILNVLSPDDGLRLVNSVPGVDCLIVTADGRVVRSEGWHRYERARPALVAFADDAKGGKDAKAAEDRSKSPAPTAWGDAYELLINLEINRPAAEPSRDATGARMSPSGSRTRMGSRFATWSSGSPSAGRGPFSGSPTSSAGIAAIVLAGSSTRPT